MRRGSCLSPSGEIRYSLLSVLRGDANEALFLLHGGGYELNPLRRDRKGSYWVSGRIFRSERSSPKSDGLGALSKSIFMKRCPLEGANPDVYEFFAGAPEGHARPVRETRRTGKRRTRRLKPDGREKRSARAKEKEKSPMHEREGKRRARARTDRTREISAKVGKAGEASAFHGRSGGGSFFPTSS